MEKRLIDYKDLTTSEKIDHIWEYYKLHIIGTLIGLFIIGWMLNHYIINPPPTVTFDITFFGNYADTEKLDGLKTDIDKIVIPEGANEESNVEFLSTSDELDPNMLQATVTKMMGKATLKEYDIMIFEGDAYKMFTDEDVLMPIEDIVSLPASWIDQSRYTDNTSLGINSDKLMLIDVSDKSFFRTVYGSDASIYVGVYVATQHRDKIEKGLEYILNTLE